MEYNTLSQLTEDQKNAYTAFFRGILSDIRSVSNDKVLLLIQNISLVCRLNHSSIENKWIRDLSPSKFHPISPVRGEVYDAQITEGVGSELSGNHLVVIIQNSTGNIYAEKVNVVPIEGDGKIINRKYQLPITNNDLKYGNLKKNPSRIIVTDILTLDKARLSRKVCILSPELLNKLDVMLKKQLGL